MRAANADHPVKYVAPQQDLSHLPGMEKLRDMIDQLDRLHANAWLDVRRRDLFKERALGLWPHLSQEIRDLLRRASNSLALAVLPLAL